MQVETVAGFPILTIVTFIPLLGALLLALVPRGQALLIRNIALGVSALGFVFSLRILADFDVTAAGFQMVEQRSWIEALGITYFLGVDGLSLWLVLLTTFLSPIIILGAFSAIETNSKEFYMSYLVLETGMLGALISLDVFLFYIFWEFMLIPMFLMIGIWGGQDRIYATVKFFLFTMVGSLLMLVGIIYIYIKAGHSTFSLLDFVQTELSYTEQLWLFGAFGLAFAIKVPIFPFHTWLPDAHVQAPTAGSVVLAGVLLKMGTYGFVRFAIPLFPEAAGAWSMPIMLLSVIGIIYGALVAYAQKDIKKLVAYSSVSHLGFVMLGLMAMSQEAVEGAILQMINHGISTGGLFLLVGMIYERRHTRLIEDYGGIARVVPWFATMLMIMTLSSIGLPGTNGFIGEFLILSGTFTAGLGSVLQAAPEPGSLQHMIAAALFASVLIGILAVAYALFRDMEDPITRKVVPGALVLVAVLVVVLWRAELYGLVLQGVNALRTFRNYSLAMGTLATTGVILGAIYMLSMYRRVLFGPVTQVKNQNIKDLNLREWVVLMPLVAAIFVIGFFPSTMLDKMHASVESFVRTYQMPMTEHRSPETVPRMKQKLLIEQARAEADEPAQVVEAARERVEVAFRPGASH
ncbi:MAG: hypothetical protein AMXMBFR64_12160 [Myxococcales bacterium]